MRCRIPSLQLVYNWRRWSWANPFTAPNSVWSEMKQKTDAHISQLARFQVSAPAWAAPSMVKKLQANIWDVGSDNSLDRSESLHQWRTATYSWPQPKWRMVKVSTSCQTENLLERLQEWRCDSKTASWTHAPDFSAYQCRPRAWKARLVTTGGRWWSNYYALRRAARPNGWDSPAHRCYDTTASRWQSPHVPKDIMAPPQINKARQSFRHEDAGDSWLTPDVQERQRKNDTSIMTENCRPSNQSRKRESCYKTEEKDKPTDGFQLRNPAKRREPLAEQQRDGTERLKRQPLEVAYDPSAWAPRMEE